MRFPCALLSPLPSLTSFSSLRMHSSPSPTAPTETRLK
jgi:hypothetical protein